MLPNATHHFIEPKHSTNNNSNRNKKPAKISKGTFTELPKHICPMSLRMSKITSPFVAYS